jgi:hypothetical protein
MSVATWKSALGKAVIPVERVWLRDIAAEVEAQFGAETVIVNIGIFRGATMYCLRAGAPQARLVGIDTVYPQGVALDPRARAQVLVGDSGKLHASFDGPVHMLFIDGDHSYEAVRRDIAGWAPKLPAGGVIAFHDFKTEPKVAAKHAGIKRAVLEWEREAGWLLIAEPGSIRAYRRPAE